jgi:hypothetical protein
MVYFTTWIALGFVNIKSGIFIGRLVNMNKRQLLSKLEKEWTDFHNSYDGLTDVQLLKPGATGDWSVRDLIVHVSWWEAEALEHLPQILEGMSPPRYSDLYGGIDEFNASMRDQKRSLTLAEVHEEALETHRRLVEYIHSVPDEQITQGERFVRRLRLDTYSHYPLHARMVRAWRERSGWL